MRLYRYSDLWDNLPETRLERLDPGGGGHSIVKNTGALAR